MAATGSYWQLLAATGSYWQVLEVSGSYCQLVVYWCTQATEKKLWGPIFWLECGSLGHNWAESEDRFVQKHDNRERREQWKFRATPAHFHSTKQTIRSTDKGYYGPGTNQMVGLDYIMISGEVGRSWWYCNTRPTRDKAGASSWTSSPFKNQFNIEGGTWPPVSDIKLIRTDTTLWS